MTGTTVPSDPIEDRTGPLGPQVAGAGGRSPAPALGTYGTTATPPPSDPSQKRQKGRLTRHRTKRAQRAHTLSKSSALCWMAAGGGINVDVGRNLTAHVGGVLRCGSPWACPLCAPVVRERRAQDIEAGLAVALALGMGVEFVTLTVRHHLKDSLVERLDVMATSLHALLKGSPWERRRAALGYVGAIRSIEVNWGPLNGWHPHNHAVLIFDRPLTDEERQDLRDWMHGRWAGILDRGGFGSINEHGVDIRQVFGSAGVSEYLTKVEGGWSAGLELTRGDLKKGGATMPATGLLVEFAETGDTAALRLWREYESATFGRRAIQWSPGLRARLLGTDDEVSDVEAAASEALDVTVLRLLIGAEVWNPIVKAGRTGELLTEVEFAAAALLALSTLWGVDPPPLIWDGSSEAQ